MEDKVYIPINKQLPSLYDPVEYILGLPSKKFRPSLCHLTATILKEVNADTETLGRALEVFHNFTLMHDDVMDNAPLRRGQATVHKKWSVSQAILSGDVMLIKAYEQLGNIKDATKSQIALKWFNKIAIEVCEGQQLDMDFEQKTAVNETEYLEMIRLKTAVLIGLSMVFGAISVGVEKNALTEIYKIGEQIGLLFQLQDDYLDVYGSPENFGKQVGGDIIEGKKTFAYLKAVQLSKTPELLQKVYLDKSIKNTDKIKAVRDLFDKTSLKEHLEADMQKHYDFIVKNIKNSILKGKATPLLSLLEKMYLRVH